MTTAFSRTELKEIAKGHRLLLWSIVVGLGATLLYSSLGSVAIPISIAATLFQVFALYKLATSLKVASLWIVLLVLGVVIPILGFLVLLSIHDKAMKAMKAAGVKVGFMGADPSSIE